MKTLIMYILCLLIIGLLFSCQGRNFRHDEKVFVTSMGATIEVKISYPGKWDNNKIIIWSQPSLVNDFFTDTDSIAKRDIWMSPILRKALLDSGYVNIEYIGRYDSIQYMNRKYSISDSNTKATDLECLIDYVKKNPKLRNKKIILIGHSEGGYINAKVASEQKNDIYALIQLASFAISVKQNAEYRRERIVYPAYLMYAHFPEVFDEIINASSSLDSYHTADIDGIKQFFKENFQPVETFIYEFDEMDSVFFHVDLYMKDRWVNENEKTKALLKGWNNYLTKEVISIFKKYYWKDINITWQNGTAKAKKSYHISHYLCQ